MDETDGHTTTHGARNDVQIEPIYEIEFDGEMGAVVGYHVDGHLDLARTDEIMAALGDEEWSEAPERGWDVTHTWVRNVPALDVEGEPFGGVWSYAYSAIAAPGARPVTLVVEESTWRYRCVNHPDEVATTGQPRAQVLGEELIQQRDPGAWEQICDGRLIYQCRACSNDFQARMRAARAAAIAALNEGTDQLQPA